jgi:tRNA A37 methylthiotransferase MiaB
MQPATIDLTIYKGSTYSKIIQWKTGTPALPVNLSGCTARMQIRKRVTDTEILDTLTTENSKLQIYDAVNGRFKISIPANVSSAYNFNTAVYDLEIVFPDTTVVRVIEGCLSAVPEVTR